MRKRCLIVGHVLHHPAIRSLRELVEMLRKLTVVGSKRMAVVDDMETERKLTIYEKSAVVSRTDSYGEYVQVRVGDIVCPRLPGDEPLRLECEHFIAAIRSPSPFAASSREGAAVVHVLEALQESLDRNGEVVQLSQVDARDELALRRVATS
jgi:predicted dehydrogenase